MKSCRKCGEPVAMAEGGDPQDDEAPVVEGSEPTPEDLAASEGSEPTAEDVAAAEGGSAPAPAPAAAPAPVAPQAPAAASGDANTIDVVGVRKPAPVALTPGQEMKVDGDAYRQDLDLGHIKPETYQSLFAKKDTVGKIGTLFGLILSGAGSGLAHQSNAVMEMMNKEIGNDLEAQKSSHQNAQNIYQLNLRHQMQQAEVKKMQIDQQLAQAKNPAEIDSLKAQASHLGVEARVKAEANARIQMNWNALHSLVQSMKRIPETLPNGAPNPMYQQAQQKLMMLNQGIQGENYNIADRAEAALALGQAVAGGSSGGANPEDDFQKGQAAMRVSGNAALADDKAARHIPGVDGMASIPLTSQDREEVLAGVQFQNQLKRFIDWTKKHSGDLNLKERAEGEALAAQVQGAYRLATKGGVYKEGEQGFISNVIDSTPTKFFNSVRVLPKLEAVRHESAAQLDERLKSKGFKGYQGPKAPPKKAGGKPQGASGGWGETKAKSSGPTEGATGTYGGKPTVYRNGKWTYK